MCGYEETNADYDHCDYCDAKFGIGYVMVEGACPTCGISKQYAVRNSNQKVRCHTFNKTTAWCGQRFYLDPQTGQTAAIA